LNLDTVCCRIVSDRPGGEQTATSFNPDSVLRGLVAPLYNTGGMSPPYIEVGRVDKVHGVIRYLGPTAFAGGEWAGIELEAARGKNDGAVDGVSYFDCGAGRGLFVRSSVLRPKHI